MASKTAFLVLKNKNCSYLLVSVDQTLQQRHNQCLSMMQKESQPYWYTLPWVLYQWNVQNDQSEANITLLYVNSYKVYKNVNLLNTYTMTEHYSKKTKNMGSLAVWVPRVGIIQVNIVSILIIDT